MVYIKKKSPRIEIIDVVEKYFKRTFRVFNHKKCLKLEILMNFSVKKG